MQVQKFNSWGNPFYSNFVDLVKLKNPMNSRIKSIIFALAVPVALLSAAPQPLMVVPAKRVIALDFEKESDVSKKWMSFRKETTFTVEDGYLNVIPPAVANAGTEHESKWGDSDFARAGMIGLPKDYVCKFRLNCIKPTDTRLQEKGLIYIDLGHRVIRTTFSRKGTTLLLENHLMGREADVSSKILQEAPDLTLEYGKWYDVMAEVKGDEVVIQIGDQVLYGNDSLIAGDRYDTFNFDANGAGFLIDDLEVRGAGDFQTDWAAKRMSLGK